LFSRNLLSMQTEIVPAASPNEQRTAIDRAIKLLRADAVVALPTETVYGLAANALSAEAVAKIFEAKERPKFDPLIVHLPDRAWLEHVARVEPEIQELVEGLAGSFWPGPLTIILPRTDIVPALVTAGLTTVAVRMSAHPVFQEVVRTFAQPLSHPRANPLTPIS